MSKEETDIFNCSICLEHFKKPKKLPCQHTFCESCLDTYIKSSTRDGTLSSKSLLCPLCRQTVKPPDTNSKPDEWASLMPDNSMITSLMQMSEVGVTDIKINESKNCGPCKRDEEVSTGLYWCPNCLEFLCENCKKFHKRIKASEMHKVIPVDEMEKENNIVAEMDEPCPEHVGENLKVFCVRHKTMCCVICIATHHSECQEIKTLEEMADKMEKDQSGVKFINCLDDMKTRLGETAEDRQENIECLKNRHKDIMSQMEVLVEQVKSNLDAFLEEFGNKFCSLNEQQNGTLSETKQKIECLLKTLEYGEQMLKFLSRNGSPKQLFIAIEKFKMQVLDHLHQLEMDSCDDNTVNYKFTVGDIFQRLKTSSSETELAQVEPKYEICKKPIIPVITEISSLCDHQMHKQRVILKADISKFEAVKLWDVKGLGLFSSGVFLDNETLVCCDCKNKFLKAYDEKGSFICDLKLDYSPLNMDVFENEILVLAHKKNLIYTYTFKKNNFKELQKMEIPYTSKGIAVVENKIVITDGQNFDVLTVFGDRLQTISVEDFSLASFCHIAADKSNIYYNYNGSLIELSLTGKSFTDYNLPSTLKTKHSRGIAIDQSGNKFICDTRSDCICVLSKDCQKHCFLKTNVEPFAIQFEKNGCKFFVSNSNNQDNSDILLEMYEIHLKK